MKYCELCGTKLAIKQIEKEGEVPYCPSCRKAMFPHFSTAVSMIVLSPDQKKILLIQQYGKKRNILVAGYVNKGEAVEEALQRELWEEIGCRCLAYRYMKSSYFARTNTLMLNFAIIADSMSLEGVDETEVDQARWYTFDEAARKVADASLAESFLLHFLAVYGREKEGFWRD